MQKAPALQTRISGYGKELSVSLMTAVLGAGALCGALALVIFTYEAFSEPVVENESLTTQYVETVKKVKPPVSSAPQRLITTPSGPAFAVMQTEAPESDLPEFVEVPPSMDTTSDLLVLEELDSENPFAEKPKPVAPKVPTKTSTAIAKNTTPAKRSGPSQAELDRREQERRAALGKKIVQNASLLSQGAVSYPKSARRKRLEGKAIVLVTVGSSGKVASCQISKSSGHATLDQSALSAARRSRFRPAKNGLGQAVSVRVALPFNFRLNG